MSANTQAPDKMKEAQEALAAKRALAAGNEAEKALAELIAEAVKSQLANLPTEDPKTANLRQEGWANFAKAQGEFSPVVFDKENPHFHSKYASIQAVLKATRPALNKYGLVLTTQPLIVGDNTIARTRIVYKGVVLIEGDWYVSKMNTPPQQQGSGNTYARRYAIQDLLGVAADEDDDGNGAQEVETGNKSTNEKPNAGAASDALGF